MPSEQEAKDAQFGKCLGWALSHQQAHPHLSLGMHYISGPTGADPSHIFTHDDKYAYDSNGVHELPYDYNHLNMGDLPEEIDSSWRGRTQYGMSADQVREMTGSWAEPELFSKEHMMRYWPDPQRRPDVVPPTEPVDEKTWNPQTETWEWT